MRRQGVLVLLSVIGAPSLSRGDEFSAAIVIVVPASRATNVSVRFDGGLVPPEKLGVRVRVTPGAHHIEAEGEIEGALVRSERDIDVAEGATEPIVVSVDLPSDSFITPGQIKCMQAATDEEQVQTCCCGPPEPAFHLQFGLETSGYHDSLAVDVLAPAVRALVYSPRGGWSIGARYGVDVITAASPDVITGGSSRMHELRHDVSISGRHQPGLWGISGGAGVSSEWDCLSFRANVAVTRELNDKLVVPTLGYSVRHDTIGRGNLSFEESSRDWASHEFHADVDVVMTPHRRIVLDGRFVLERGDASSPYRYVPAVPEKVPEQLPRARERYEIGARLAERIASSSLRVEERLYDDTWSIRATTTDIRWLFDVAPRWNVGPHARVYAQTGADFQAHDYPGVPPIRTTSRALTPLLELGGGGSLSYTFASDRGTTEYRLFVGVDGTWTRFWNHPYVTKRIAGFSTIGLEVDIP